MWEIIRRILKIALPVVGEMMLYMLIWVIDTIMVGNYGGEIAVSAVGLSSEIFYTTTNLLVGMGLAIAMTSIISRAMGAKDILRAKKFAALGVQLTIIISIILTAIFYFYAEEILILAKAEGKVLEMGSKYFRICSLMVIFNLIRNGITSVFVGCQDTKTPLYVAGVINIVNLFLDYTLIFGKFGFPEMGIEGAAWATVVANVAGFIFIILKLKKLPFKLEFSKISFKDFSELISLAIPASFQEGAFGIARLIAVIMIMSLGSTEFAANQITVAIESISFMPGYGIAIACSTLVGYSIGEKNHKRVKEYFLYSTIIGVVIMGIPAFLFYFVPEFLIGVFLNGDDRKVVELGAICLKIAAFAQIPSAVAMILEGGLKGSGDTKKPFYIVFFCSWFIRLPLMTYFIYIKRYPITTAWKIILLHWTIESIIVSILVYRKYFKKRNPLKI
ncbi:MAG: MATE family efflux transporter [Fusobacteriaceae bacterium]